jgi:hypothetical protein
MTAGTKLMILKGSIVPKIGAVLVERNARGSGSGPGNKRDSPPTRPSPSYWGIERRGSSNVNQSIPMASQSIGW